MATDTRTSVLGARRMLVVLAVAFAAVTAATSAPAAVDEESTPRAPRVTRCSGSAPDSVTQVVNVTRRTQSAGSYDWPLKPFNRQHPVRGFFNDPRDGAHGSHSFHRGIDISAPDGTPVYAVKAGRAYLSSGRAVAVAEPSGRVLAYWHIVPVVRDRQQVERHQLLGHIEAPWGHVHFGEVLDGKHVNPLRPGALGPYTDDTPPSIAGVRLSRIGAPEIVVDAFDTTPMRVPGPWRDMPVAPALITWRVVRGTETVLPWRTGVDFRQEVLHASRFGEIYAADTRKNSPPRAGRYCFRMAGAVALRSLAAGRYELEIRATDTGGNAATATFALRLP